MKKRICVAILTIALLAAAAFFLWPRSFADVAGQAQSVVVRITESSLDQESVTFRWNATEPEFAQLLELLDNYSYHFSLRTFEDPTQTSANIEGNDAGWWLHVDFYSEPDGYGDCWGITFGGTGEVIVDYAVYRMGCFGNSRAMEMMDAFRQMLGK